MREKALGHEVVGLNSRGDVARMDAAGDPHQHCLRTLHDLAVHAEEIRLLQRLVAKVVVVVVPMIVDRGIKGRGVLADKGPHLVRDKRGWPSLLVSVLVQRPARLVEGAGGVLVQVRHRDPRSQGRKVRVPLRHVRARFCGKSVDLRGCDAIVEALHYLLGDGHGIDVLGVQPAAEMADAPCDAVELDLLLCAVTLDDVHLARHGSLGQ
mmetsp:Transcript_96279/g.272209  ORF Transcript_96279/g.272209 Transcript_96279/m.272209 type:complete len:209 (+) Transcript_96279:105-731(+)